MKYSSILVVPALFLGACSSTPAPTPEQPHVAPTSASSEFDVIEASIVPPAALEAAASVSAQVPYPEGLESIFTGEKFRQRLKESYLFALTDIEPRVTADELEYLIEIQELVTEDEIDDAIEELEDVLEDDSASAVFDFTLASLHMQADRLEPAESGFLAAIAKFGNFRRAYKNLGLLYMRMGNFEAGTDSFIRVLELGEVEATTYGLLAFAYGSDGDYVAAESAYRMASLLEPRDERWKMGLAEAYFRQGRFADASALTARLIETDPNNVRMWMLQANAFLGLEKPLLAAQNLEVVDSLGGSTSESLALLGRIYINQKLFDVAVDAFGRMLALDEPGPIEAPLSAAKGLAAHSALDETSTLLDRMAAVYGEGDDLEVDVQKDVLRLRSRIAAWRNPGGEEEIRVLEQIVKLDPLDGEALILIGDFHAAAGDVERAILSYEHAAEVERTERRSKLRHAQLLVSQERHAEALPLLKRAYDLDPRPEVQAFIEEVERSAR